MVLFKHHLFKKSIIKSVFMFGFERKKFVVVALVALFHELLGKAKGCIVLYVGAKKIWAFIHIIM